jgi:hypothetical protein
MKDDLNNEVPNGTHKTTSFEWCVKLGWGVEVGEQAPRGSCYTFWKLDKKTYHTKFNLKMFICKGYNGRGVDNVNVIYNGWK